MYNAKNNTNTDPKEPVLTPADLPSTLVNSCIEEQETTILWTRNDRRAVIYTASNIILTKLRKLLDPADDGSPSEYTLEKIIYQKDPSGTKQPVAVEVSCPVNAISFRSGKKREISEERRAALSNMMKARNGGRQNSDD